MATPLHSTTFPPMPDKDPDAVLFYLFDWRKWLAGTAVIQSYEILIDRVTDPPLVQEYATVVQDGTGVRVRITGGQLGQTYTITCRITTNESPAQTDDRSAILRVRQR
ncbi:MAG: hypothetical protein ABS36_11035 [Acidobacteria bacterium SCN 69-37]|nr:MAG: hypothetical protein ABS36_11035 [Acidobacteria bacterium SCN 69-37]